MVLFIMCGRGFDVLSAAGCDVVSPVVKIAWCPCVIGMDRCPVSCGDDTQVVANTKVGNFARFGQSLSYVPLYVWFSQLCFWPERCLAQNPWRKVGWKNRLRRSSRAKHWSMNGTRGILYQVDAIGDAHHSSLFRRKVTSRT